MDKVFTKDFDNSYKLKAFPDVSSAKGQSAVVGFVRDLLAHPSKDPLWKLSEVRFYEHRGALKEKYADAAFKKILPQQASKLKSVSSDDEIRSLLSEWLTVKESFASGDDEEEDGGDDDFR